MAQISAQVSQPSTDLCRVIYARPPDKCTPARKSHAANHTQSRTKSRQLPRGADFMMDVATFTELSEMKILALSRRAAEMGVDANVLEQADDKLAIIGLIVAASVSIPDDECNAATAEQTPTCNSESAVRPFTVRQPIQPHKMPEAEMPEAVLPAEVAGERVLRVADDANRELALCAGVNHSSTLGAQHPDGDFNPEATNATEVTDAEVVDAGTDMRKRIREKSMSLGDGYTELLSMKRDFAYFLIKNGDLEAAERVFAEVRGGREDVLGSTAMETLHSQREYADLVRRQGLNPTKTKQLFKELVATVSRSLDRDFRRTLDADELNCRQAFLVRANWGFAGACKRIASTAEDFEEANLLYLEVVKLQSERMETVRTNGSAADLLEMQMERVQIDGGRADLLKKMGKLDEAAIVYNSVIQHQEAHLTRNAPQALISKAGYAGVLFEQGRVEEAAALYRVALKGLSRAQQGNDAQESLRIEFLTLSTKREYADLLKIQGRLEDAERMYREVEQRQIETLGARHPDTMRTRTLLANMLTLKLGKYQEAKTILKDVIHSQENTLGSDHTDTLTTQRDLAGVYKRQDKFDQANDLYQRVIAVQKRAFGPNHKETLRTMGGYADLLEQFNRLDGENGAKQLYTMVIAGQESNVGPNDPSTLKSKAGLALVLQKQGLLQQSKELFDIVIKAQTESVTIGANHRDTLVSKGDQGLLLAQMAKSAAEDLNDAERLLLEAAHGLTQQMPGSRYCNYFCHMLHVVALIKAMRAMGHDRRLMPRTRTAMSRPQPHEPVQQWMTRKSIDRDVSLSELLTMCHKDMWLGEKHVFAIWVATQLGLLEQGRKYELKEQADREFDVFISHAQSTGQDQCMMLNRLLTEVGLKVWYDMDADDLTLQAMEEGVSNSRNVLVFLSTGVMSRHYCIMEQRWGRLYKCNFIGVVEFDERHGGTENGPNRIFDQEKASAPDDLKYLFDAIEFIKYERRRGQREAMIERLRGSALGYSPRTISGSRGMNHRSPSEQEEQEEEQEQEP